MKPEIPLGPRQPVPRIHCSPPDYPDSCELCFQGMTATHFYRDPDQRITEHRYGRCEQHINGLLCELIPCQTTEKSSTSPLPSTNEMN